MKKDRTFLVHCSDQDIALVAAIRASTGAVSNAEVWRQGLRALAEKLKLKAPETSKPKRP